MKDDRDYKTRRGALLATMEHRRQPDGSWLVEGYSIEPYGLRGFRIEDEQFDTLTAALEWVAEEIS